eukprot:Clim_evm3s215 gene=Clim_evmTU3s215
MVATGTTVNNLEELKSALSKVPPSAVCGIHFVASWAEPCKQINDALAEITKTRPGFHYYIVDAEEVEDVTEEYEVESVPTVVFVRPMAPLTAVDQVVGANVPELVAKVKKLADQAAAAAAAVKPAGTGTAAPAQAAAAGAAATNGASAENLDGRLKRLINAAPVMLFMKGIPTEPRCGFSNQMIGLLEEQNIKYQTFNILADNEVREGLKKFSDWPTYPQLYIDGELIGGLDIVKEMIESGEFAETIPDAAKKEDLNTRLEKIIKSNEVMLFVKGDRDTPRCGFSRRLMDMFKDRGIDFESFDILQDEEVRQGLKKYSDWPTYPQVYVRGELIGGLDIVQEMIDNGEFATVLHGE